MQQGDPITVDLRQEGSSGQILPRPPLLTSRDSGWHGLSVESHVQSENDTGEHVLSTHCIAFGLSSYQCERWLDGRFYKQSSSEGRLTIIPANITHRATSKSNNITFAILALTPNFFQQVAQEWVNPDVTQVIPHPIQSPDPLFLGVWSALKNEIESSYLGGRLYGESLANTLAVHLLRNYCNRTPHISAYSNGLSTLKLNRALDYIHANLLNENLSLDAIATHLSMSQYYFCTLFKKSMGISPWQYVIQQRVERAKDLLKVSDLSILEVALLCGFANQTHLNKHFRKLIGITPKQYQSR
jgi:AraC family transcriptional regulator